MVRLYECRSVADRLFVPSTIVVCSDRAESLTSHLTHDGHLEMMVFLL